MIPHEELGARLAAALEVPAWGPGQRPAGQLGSPTARPTVALDTLARRRSVREYGTGRVPLDVLGRAIDAGFDADSALWSSPGPLDVLVLATRVSGLRSGVLHAVLAGPAYESLGALDPTDATLQRDLAGAAALLIVRGRLGGAVDGDSARQYRQLLTRAGAWVTACHLAAIEYGLVGCPFDGLLPHRALRSGTAPEPLVLCGLALGIPAEAEADG
ncbi:nitroreductase family protein [Streptomyces sp. NPDC046900]|uniref:nitroreductase family protein n=1 Tax=Streptomyces sp. NPDC046900 TaxID=3155473 RepID=UPI0033DA0B31